MSPRRVIEQFRRQSLVEQVAARLEKGIRDSEWPTRLPAERELSAQWGISRMTLRAALAVMRRKGLIRADRGRGVAPLPGPASMNLCSESKVIGLLIGEHAALIPSEAQIIIRGIEHHLHAAGYALSLHVVGSQYGGKVTRRLEELVARYRPGSWMLYAVNPTTQRWFKQRRIPVLVLGTCYQGVDLPDWDVDFRAVCRHAVTTLWRLGHRSMALVTLKNGFGGDLLGEQGFSEACRDMGVRCRILYHAGDSTDLLRGIGALIRENERPTALVVARSRYALTLASYLREQGLRLPGDISLICRDSNDFLAWSVPPIARYALNADLFTKRGARALVRLATGEQRLLRLTKLMPRFILGATVGPPPRT